VLTARQANGLNQLQGQWFDFRSQVHGDFTEMRQELDDLKQELSTLRASIEEDEETLREDGVNV
jgi:hypothetical protein